MAFGEFVFIEMRNRHAHVLFFATCIGKTKINKLDFVFLDVLHDVGDGLGHQFLLDRLVRKKSQMRIVLHLLCHKGLANRKLGKITIRTLTLPMEDVKGASRRQMGFINVLPNALI
jgi:hypothetical protein